jgi:hypothetical protein
MSTYRVKKRRLEDRLAVRLPWLYKPLARVVWTIWRRNARTRFGHALAVRVTLRSYDAFNRGDLDALRGMYHPDSVWDLSHFPEWPMQETYHGYDGIDQVYNDWWEPWAEIIMVPARIRVVAGTHQPRVVITLSIRGRGGGSGVETTLTVFQVGELLDGLISRVDHFTSQKQAFDAGRQ